MKRLAALLALLLPALLAAQEQAVPQIQVTLGQGSQPALSMSLQVLLLFTVLSVAPAILVMTTSFVRIVIVLGFLRTALAIQQPGPQVMAALALFLTGFIMAPTLDAIRTDALAPLQAGDIQADVALERASVHIKAFMLRQVQETEMRLFLELSGTGPYATPEEVPLRIVIPAFMLGELKIAFQMGVFVLLPFLVIDLVVASVLMSLGMMMLPPTVVALPLKLMVFVVADGWTLLVTSLVRSFGAPV